MENIVFTGWNLKQTGESIQLTQNSYIDKLELEDLNVLPKGPTILLC